MDRVDFSQPGGMPDFPSTWEFLQAANRLAFKGVCSMLDPTLVGCVVLSGGVIDEVGRTVTEGYAMYKGELMFIPAHSYAAGSAIRWVPYESNHPTLDPRLFKDATQKSIHKVRQLKVEPEATPAQSEFVLVSASSTAAEALLALIQLEDGYYWIDPDWVSTTGANGWPGTIYVRRSVGGKLHVRANLNLIGQSITAPGMNAGFAAAYHSAQNTYLNAVASNIRQVGDEVAFASVPLRYAGGVFVYMPAFGVIPPDSDHDFNGEFPNQALYINTVIDLQG